MRLRRMNGEATLQGTLFRIENPKPVTARAARRRLERPGTRAS